MRQVVSRSRLILDEGLNAITGNYVQFDDVTIATGKILTLTVTPESLQATEIPAVKAIQLVRFTPGIAVPELSITRTAANATLNWAPDASGFVLESSSCMIQSEWILVPGSPNPIAQAGSINVPASDDSRFYRLRRP